MPDTTARIRAKGLDTTGVTEAMAESLFNQGAGKYHMAVVEWRTEEPHGPNSEGKKRIDLVLTQVEPARDDRTTDTLRELARAMARQRRTDDGELTLDGTDDPAQALSDANQQAGAIIERDEEGRPVGIWDGDPASPLSQKTWGADTKGDAQGDVPAPEDGDGADAEGHEPDATPADTTVVMFSDSKANAAKAAKGRG